MFVFALAAAVIAGASAGLIPALQSASPDLTNALKAGSRDGVMHRSRLRSALVASQAALSVVLLVGAVLFVRSLQQREGSRHRLLRRSPGVRRRELRRP